MRHLGSFAILLVALVLYAKGLSPFALSTVLLAVAFEAWFWVRIASGPPTATNSRKAD